MTAARLAAAIPAPPVHETRDLEVAGSGGPIAIRLYRPVPPTTDPQPAMIFFHSGGWVVGGLDSHDILCRRLAVAGDVAILSVDYRLAPEARFPAAVDDAAAAVRWMVAEAAALGIDPARIAFGGDSAGGNLAAVMALMARDGAFAAPRLQILIYPVTDLSMRFPSYDVAAGGLPVTRATMAWFIDHYMLPEADRLDWRASPLHAGSLAGTAPAFILTAGYDPLADEGAAYAARLRVEGVATVHSHCPGQAHGFMTMGALFPTTARAVAELGAALRLGLAAVG